MKTTEGNKLIAEFMGFKENSTTSVTVLYNEVSCEVLDETKLSYHTSWDWLMPVVEKIEQIGASVIIGRMFCKIEYKDPLNKKHFDIEIASGVKINAVNGAINEFIKWYNKNKQS